MGKGWHHTKETKRKISLNHRKHQTEETRLKLSRQRIGIIFSEEHKEKLRQAKLKNPTRYWKGKHFSEEYKLKLRQARVGRFTKEKCGAWRGGITTINNQIRGSDKYKQWIKAIFTRDNYTCMECCSRSSEGKRVVLHAHHIVQFYLIIREIKHNFPLFPVVDIAMNYPKLWDINNGVTLCSVCHNKINHKR